MNVIIKMIRIGKDLVFDKRTKKLRKSQYKDVKTDGEGWIDSSLFVPFDFDLVQVKNQKNRVKWAWISGNNWDGMTINHDDKILYWKREIA